jgi:TonB family protein
MTLTKLWKNWEGRAVGRFLLAKWVGGSDHSAVFSTERFRERQQKLAAVKLISAEGLDEDVQLSRWGRAAKLSHPHLIRLFESGRSAIDGTRVLYVVMEYAEENLSEILPLRALAPGEASEMLQPTAEALAYLHQSGFTHGHITPSNIMAVGNHVRISADGLGKTGEPGGRRAPSAYDAPEVATVGPSPEADIWSLGITLVAVMTQNEPKLTTSNRGRVAVPETIPEPFREIARQCLQVDPQRRCTAADILGQLQTHNRMAEVPVGVKIVDASPPEERLNKRFVVPIVIAALFLLAWMGSRLMVHSPAIPAAETHTASAPPRVDTAAAQSPAPFSENKKPAEKGVARGSVLQQVLPEVSRSAQNTIEGHVKVSVHVSVDASGNVSQAKFVSAGPSKYFADRALTAARGWKFTPPQVDGQAAASEWILRFQFGRASTQVFPAETKP